jgi:microcystin-dependent protein
MPNPTYNKWKSTTIYGNLSVRDLTNSAGSSVVEVASIDLSGNFLSRGDSTFTKAVICNGTITNGTDLTTKTYVDNAVSSGGGSSILGLNNAWTGINTYNSYFPTSTLPTSTTITTSSIVNKGMLDTIYQSISGMSSYLTTSTASSTYQTIANMSSYLTTSTASSTYQTIANMTNYLTTSTAASTYSTLANDNIFSGENTFTNTILSENELDQYTAPRGTGLVNNFIRTLFLEQIEAGSIFRVNAPNNNTGLRVATGDYPYLPTNSPYTTTQIFTIAAQQTIAGSQISITQAATTATNTANYQIANNIIGNFTIPTNFSKAITLNIPISIRNAGTWTLSGTALQATITNTINSMTAIIYVNGIAYDTNPTVQEQNSNSLTRSTTISYTTTGTKTIALDQYFFNININLDEFFTSTYISRDNSITNTLQIVLSANITNTIARVSNTGNFTATNTLTFVSNTGVSTISNTSTTATSTTYSPNSNGTNYAAATTTSYYIDTTNTTGGTTYTNHLRANTFNLLPAGMVVVYTSSTAPTGWLLCNGTAYNASTSTGNPIYQELYNVIGNQFGGTNNTDFKVPDYRGMFLRGAGTNAQTGYTTYVGQTLNTQQTDAVEEHGHNVIINTKRGTASDSANFIMSSNNVGADNNQVKASSNQTGRTSLVETRPVSYSVNYLIKY